MRFLVDMPLSPGLILFRGGNWSDADIIVRPEDVLEGVGEEDIERSLLVVERDRVRRRRLPLFQSG